jgi:hypothetical protein
VVKKGGKLGEREVKNHPSAPVWSPSGDQAGELKSFPREEKSHSSLVPGWPDSKSGRNPHWVRRDKFVFLLWVQFTTALFMRAVITVQFGWAVAGGGGFASRYVGGEKDPLS